MKIGILGGTGMLGHHAASAATAAGHDVVVLHRAGSDLSRIADLDAECRIADADQPASLEHAFAGLDAVVNAAAYYPTTPKPWRDEVRTALQQTEGFLAACRAAGVSRAVYVGGSIALAPAPAGQLGDETCVRDQPPRTRNPYVQLKWAMDDHYAQASDGRLSVSIAIPAMTFGPYDYGPSTGQLLTRLAKGELRNYVRGNRNVIAAEDAGRGILAVVERGAANQRYLLTGTNTSMDQLMALAADYLDLQTPRPVALPVARAVSAIQGLRYRLGGPPPQISATAIAVMSAGQHLSGDKAARALDYQPSFTLEQTITGTLDWFRAVGYIPAAAGA